VATKPLLDFDSLLAPIPGDSPSGPSLRYAGDYDEIESLRPKPDRDAVEAGGQEGQWPKIQKLTEAKIKSKSKDLQLAVWLTEAMIHSTGIAGVRDGVQLIFGLLENFWEDLHPQPRDGDMEFRAAPLLMLLGDKGASWVLEVPLTKQPAKDPETEGQVPVTFNLWNAVAVEKSADKASLASPLNDAVAKTPNDFFVNLYEDLEGATAQLELLRLALDERFGDVAPGVTALRTALEQCTGRIGNVLKQRGVRIGAADEEASEVGENGEPHGESVNGTMNGPLRSREDALARLREVADYFRRAEPHSPVSRLIERAITWSRMSFEQLLHELVMDSTARQQINTTLGIRDDEAAASESYTSSSEDG
jgi:type VI secretion system protein ImpA